MTARQRRIGVVTTCRADLWPLLSVLQALGGESSVAVTVYAGGAHDESELRTELSAEAVTLSRIRIVGGAVSEDDPVSLTSADSALAVDVARALVRDEIELLVILGDRHELLGVAAAATVGRVPIAHIHGGELTRAAFDDAIRHALTKLSHLHFCSEDDAATRVISMGEQEWRVFVTGAPGLDRLAVQSCRFDEASLATRIGVEWRRPVGVVTYHPPTLEPEKSAAELEAIIASCGALRTVIVTGSGNDPGRAAIERRFEEWASTRRGVVVVDTLGESYAAALAYADVVIGNSSSGVLEAPSLAVPTVNVGSRQSGRLRAPSVLDAPGDAEAVSRAVARALDPEFRAILSERKNPYGDGRAGSRIASVLAHHPLDRLLLKEWPEVVAGHA